MLVVNVRSLLFDMFNKNVLTLYRVLGMQAILRKLVQAFDLEELIVQ